MRLPVKRFRFIYKNKDKPFFAYVPFNAVHTPIEASKKYLNRFPNVTPLAAENLQRHGECALDDAVGAIVTALKETQTDNNTSGDFPER